MIDVTIFFGHTIFAVYAFARSYQTDGILQALLNVTFIIVLFAVGWTISDLIVGLVIPASGYSIPNPPGLFLYGLLKMTGFFTPGNGGYGILAPKDTVSLILLTVMEVFFYRFYFRSAEHLAQAKKTA
ncbi:MAG: hypothetical protein KDC42_09320 [Ignavibacteriae bacterium]|nr:hypothetical protein [Ignavibacteriota bacterium]